MQKKNQKKQLTALNGSNVEFFGNWVVILGRFQHGFLLLHKLVERFAICFVRCASWVWSTKKNETKEAENLYRDQHRRKCCLTNVFQIFHFCNDILRGLLLPRRFLIENIEKDMMVDEFGHHFPAVLRAGRVLRHGANQELVLLLTPLLVNLLLLPRCLLTFPFLLLPQLRGFAGFGFLIEALYPPAWIPHGWRGIPSAIFWFRSCNSGPVSASPQPFGILHPL